MKKFSIKIAILIPVLSVLIVGVTIMVAIVGIVVSSSTDEMTDTIINARVNEFTNEFSAFSTSGYSTLRAISPIIEHIRLTNETPRESVVETMRQILSSNPNILGLWTCWEPNAFDGNDSNYKDKEYHDSTGRFVPYVVRDNSGISYEALLDYDHPTSGIYYQGAKNSGKEYITDPYPYEIGGKTAYVYSIAFPVLDSGRTIGVIGIDINIEDIKSIINSASILSDGYLFVLSPNGSVASHRNESLLTKSYKETWLGAYSKEFDNILANGGIFSLSAYSDITNTEMTLVSESVMVGNTGRYWAVCGVVPVSTVTESSNTLLWLIIGISLALIVVVGLVTMLLTSRNLRKLPVMTVMAERVANGDVSFDRLSSDNEPTKNEIVLLERAFTSISDSIKAQSDVMAKIARGDYSVTIPVRCEADLMNKSINEMIDQTNMTMSEIRSATTHVSAGSKQIAEGAQALAQGSTEQAASVEQLSSSISDIAQKTKDNAEMAGRAASLAHTIKDNAQKGSRQMDEMTSAVREINQASQSISKVIKVIDDIAFQTNILALNAAVEAARAGQHGKGFAVVAEEVRNLAAKSAEAAKDTGGLIANSMEKAELGAKIADETASSLVEIVSGINESSKIVDDIAKSSEEQSAGIAQINKGIDQVAQVVQQNSATAQQSAATSQEMNGQTSMLEQLITQFNLKGQGDPGAGFRQTRKPTRGLTVANELGSVGVGKY